MFKVIVTAEGFSKLGGNVAGKVMELFEKYAGDMMVEHIRSVLGTDELGLVLSPTYAKSKPTLPGYVRYPMKASDQPGILTGDLYTGVYAHLEGDEIVVEVAADHGIDKAGDDYAEALEARADYIGIGFEALEEPLAQMLLNIVFEVMNL